MSVCSSRTRRGKFSDGPCARRKGAVGCCIVLPLFHSSDEYQSSEELLFDRFEFPSQRCEERLIHIITLPGRFHSSTQLGTRTSCFLISSMLIPVSRARSSAVPRTMIARQRADVTSTPEARRNRSEITHQRDSSEATTASRTPSIETAYFFSHGGFLI